GIKTTDLYLVVRTEAPMQVSEFEEMAETIQKQAEEAKFGKLIRKIKGPFSSTLVHTLPLSRRIH
ncbi:hypothetical protein KA005_58865, partial [bacterium]|nr:hypothetical protein [bacterium]